MCLEVHSVGAPIAKVRVDPAPGFQALKDDPGLKEIGIVLEIGDPKNTNKNPICERAIEELESEIRRNKVGNSKLSDALTNQIPGHIGKRGLDSAGSVHC